MVQDHFWKGCRLNMSETNTSSSKVIQSLLVGYELLELIASSEKPLKFNEICEQTKMTKSNLHKYLHTLTSVGLLYRDRTSGMYTLGSKLVEYGMKAVNQENMMERVLPYLQEINQACKNTVLLTSWSQSRPIVVRLINSQEGLNIGAQIGTVLPVTSAAGKVFAAFLDQYLMEDWLAEEMERMDDDERSSFEKEIQFVRKTGIAFANEPLVPSISSIAIPIFNFESRLLGVIVVVGFSHTIASSIDDMMSQYLIKMRNEISQAFGCDLRQRWK